MAKKKTPKKIKAEKLPKIFRKNYKAKKFERKILKKIYIDADKTLISGLYEKQTDEKGRDIYVVDLTKPVEQNTVKRLKLVSKQIKKQRGAVKLLPLLVSVSFLIAAGLIIAMFKNVIVRKTVVSSMQGVFGAEANIKNVDLQIFDSSLVLSGIQQTNKNKPEYNLFSIDKISLDFNLTDLLRGKFHAEKIGIEGVVLDSKREKEGFIVEKIKKEKEEKTEKKKIEEKKTNYAKGASDKLKNMFASYNPDIMIKEIQDKLDSPALAKEIEGEVQNTVSKWQAVPAKMEQEIRDFTVSVQNVINADWTNVQDLTSLKSALETVNTAITQGQSLKDSFVGTGEDIKKDTDKYIQIAKDIQTAISSDKKLIDQKIAEIGHLFSKDGINEVMNDAINSMFYDITGAYYPYAVQALDFAKQAAAGAKAKTKVEKKKSDKDKTKRQRLDGRNVYYRKDRIPKILVDEVLASGYEKGTQELLFKGIIKNITSDQNIIDKDTSVKIDFKILGRENSANAIIDNRKNAGVPLVVANYNGKGYPIYANAEVFNFTSMSNITAMVNAEKTGAFDVGGILDMDISEIKGMEFEPAIVSRVYNNALSEIKTLTFCFGIGMDSEGQLKMEIKNLEKLTHQLADPVVNALQKELTGIVSQAKKDAVQFLTEKTGAAADAIKKFNEIAAKIKELQANMDDIRNQLEAKKNEIIAIQTAKLKDAAVKAVDDALKNAGVDLSKIPDAETISDAVTEKVNEAVTEKINETVNETLKNAGIDPAKVPDAEPVNEALKNAGIDTTKIPDGEKTKEALKGALKKLKR